MPTVESGSGHNCTIRGDKTVWCWGDNRKGQLGRDDIIPSAVPMPVVGLTNVEAIALGKDHSCALSGGQVWCWGDNTFGQLGLEGGDLQKLGTPVPTLNQVVEIVAGADHTCARTGGNVHCWGSNEYGQLGFTANGTGPNPNPTQVTTVADVEWLRAGGAATCAKLGGQVKCWGRNDVGQLGTGQPGGSTSYPVPGAEIDMRPDSTHGCALGEGTSKCFGDNSKGQLCELNGAELIGYHPQQIRVRFNNTCILTGEDTAGEDTVRCCGANVFGQLGRGGSKDTTAHPNPLPVVDGSGKPIAGVKHISLGQQHACALLHSEEIWCWGRNDHGQLGRPGSSEDFSTTPLKIAF